MKKETKPQILIKSLYQIQTNALFRDLSFSERKVIHLYHSYSLEITQQKEK